MKTERLFHRLLTLVTLALLTMATACHEEDDTVKIVPQRHWLTRTVAVVAPLGDASTRMRLERTAAWFCENFREAQMHDTLAIDWQIEWYDELSEDGKTLATALARRDDIVAIIGPFSNENVATFAPACLKTLKPLIAPTATSEEIIRRYAIGTSGIGANEQPFFWSLTESDVTFTSMLMSSYATMGQYYNKVMKPRAAVFAPSDAYGTTFNYWAPFYALEDNIDLLCNEQYTSTADLLARLRAHRADVGEMEAGLSSATFCVAETAQQLYEVARANRKYLLDDPIFSLIYGSTDPDDPALDSEWQMFRTTFMTYFAFAGLSEEALAALGPRWSAMLQGYEGFTPYADPATGFEISYKKRFGALPTFAECKFYDALMLAAFSCCYAEHQSELISLNDAIRAITIDAKGASVSGAAWNATSMSLYLTALEQGERLRFVGASGEISFDDETFTAATATTYVHWQLMDGQILHRNYFGSTGTHTADAKAAWKYLYDEQLASADFDSQAAGSGNAISYPTLTAKYAVLVQGSNEFMNYRHQADVLSVYQMLRRNGFPDDHIILIIDKAIATDPKNPEQGVIRSNTDGYDLLGGTDGLPVAIVDYNSANLSAADIADILTGRQSERLHTVLPQDAGNNILFYWSGHGRNTAHGGADEFVWRDSRSGQGFTAARLKAAAEQMTFRKLLVCAEPCYGEAVIRAVEGIDGVLAMSGASASEQSWADHWSNEANVWMCDRFSQSLVNCLTDNPATSFRDLFLYCAQHTLGSHAKIVNAPRFGNLYLEGPREFIIYE